MDFHKAISPTVQTLFWLFVTNCPSIVFVAHKILFIVVQVNALVLPFFTRAAPAKAFMCRVSIKNELSFRIQRQTLFVNR
jgi:hypothetical protein